MRTINSESRAAGMHPKFELSSWYMKQRMTSAAKGIEAAAEQPDATGIFEMQVTVSVAAPKVKAKRVGGLL